MRNLVSLAAAFHICPNVRSIRVTDAATDQALNDPAPAPSPEDAPTPEPTPTTPTPPETPIDGDNCDDITGIKFGEKDWTGIVKVVCSQWPSAQFGAFPVNTVGQLNQLLGHVFDEGGLYEQLNNLLVERSSKYCLRQEAPRVELSVASSENICPSTLTDELLEEIPDETTVNVNLTEGYWACTAAGDSRCDCRQRYSTVTEDTKAPFPMVSIASRPSGCEMVHNGKCYGSCPPRFRPTFLKGWFRPVCTSVCAETTFPVTCGVGCANTRTDCVAIILNQVKEVAISASKVATFFMTGTAGVILHETVVQVVKVAEFAFNVLSKVLTIADAAYKSYTREQGELATMISLYAVLKDTAAEVAQDWVRFQGLIRASSNLFLRLIDAEYGWKNVNLGWITGAIMKEGIGQLFGAFEVARAFAYAQCELATDEVAFSIENVGDQRLVGAWTQDGTTNGKPRYRVIRDRTNTVMEWSRRSGSWAIWYMDRTFGRGYWFGWVGLGWRELYETKSNTPDFPTSGWRKIEGPLPLPALVNAKNGGT